MKQWRLPAACFSVIPASQQGIKKEAMTMKPWTKLQDWSTLVLGVILFLVPVAYGTYETTANAAKCLTTSASTAWFFANSTWDAGIVSISLIAVSLWALTRPNASVTEWMRIVLGAWLFFSPWILGFATIGALAWTAWIIGILVVALAVWKLLEVRSMQTHTKATSL